MPCHDDQADYADQQATYRKLHHVTDLLCRSCRLMSKACPPDEFEWPEGLEAWWKAHQEADNRREAEERAVREKERLRQKALNRLTAAEKKALGL